MLPNSIIIIYHIIIGVLGEYQARLSLKMLRKTRWVTIILSRAGKRIGEHK